MSRMLDRLDRRSVWLVAVLIPTSLAASASTTRPWLTALLLGVGVAVSAVSLAAIARRLVADGGTTLAEGLRWLHRAGIVAVGIFILWTIVVYVNGAWDSSTPVEHDSEVLAVIATVVDPGRGALMPHTQADLRSWRSADRVERLVLAHAETRRVWVGQPVRVRLHAGRLGIPWISAVVHDEMGHARQILQVSPTAFHAMKRLIAGLLERRQLDEALAVTRRYVALYPDDVEQVQFVAGYLQVAGRYREEVELIAPAVERRPDYTSLCMLGVALARGGRPLQGIDVLDRAVRFQPDSFLAFHDLGEIYHALGRHEEAIAAYEAELVRRPRSLETRRRVQVLRDIIRAR